MKKIIVSFSLFSIAMAYHANAQRPAESLSLNFEKIVFSYAKMQEGSNTIAVPNGKGTLKFVKRGDKFFDVFFVNTNGQSIRLVSVTPGTSGAPSPSCKYPLPGACFGTADKNIGMCICKPTDISASGGEHTIGLLLPAIQKAQQAGAPIPVPDPVVVVTTKSGS